MHILLFLRKIIGIIDKELESKFVTLIVFSIVVSFIELLGVSLIMPLIELSTDPSVIQTNQYYKVFFNYFNFKSQNNFAISFGIFLLMFYFFRGFIVLLHSYYITKFSQNVYSSLVKQLFKRYLHMSYEFFTQNNKSTFSKSIITEASLVSNSVSALLTLISEVFVVLMIYILMLYVDFTITMFVTVIVALKVLFLTNTVSKRIKLKGVERAKIQQEFYKILNRFFSDYKNIKLQGDDAQESLSKEFSLYANKYAYINTIFGVLSSIPRVFIETTGFGMAVLFIIFLLMSGDGEIQNFLPTIGLYVVALYRLLPSVNRIMGGYNTIAYNGKSTDIVLDHLNIAIEKVSKQNIPFNKEIFIQSINFSYQGSKKIITNCSLSIKKNERIAIVGESGSGKSTLVDLISGLLTLSSGKILIDGIELSSNNLQNWREKIGYIPQNIFLFDGTVAQNVCFDRVYNKEKLINSLKLASIYNFLLDRDGIDTKVGDGGVHLSGGQAQRIAIARALYGDPEILIFDEATSALDPETEKNIMHDMYLLTRNMTFLLITHKLSIVSECDRIFRMKNGILVNEE
jgi:ATP-binding cassette, subfamily B, bacterial PglK